MIGDGTHSSLVFRGFVLQSFASSPGRSKKKRIHHLDPSVERRNKIAQQLEWTFEPYCVMCKELKGKNSCHNNIFRKVRKETKDNKTMFGKGSIFREFWLFSEESWYLTLSKASELCTDNYGWLYSNDSGYSTPDGSSCHSDEYTSLMKKLGRHIW